jgi:uncharacterized membrane protein
MTASPFQIWIQGAVTMGYLVVALFFVSFWRETRDRMFTLFAAGFFILSLHRFAFAMTLDNPGWTNTVFSLRLLGYLFILGAIIDRRVRASAATTREE